MFVSVQLQADLAVGMRSKPLPPREAGPTALNIRMMADTGQSALKPDPRKADVHRPIDELNEFELEQATTQIVRKSS